MWQNSNWKHYLFCTFSFEKKWNLIFWMTYNWRVWIQKLIVIQRKQQFPLERLRKIVAIYKSCYKNSTRLDQTQQKINEINRLHMNEIGFIEQQCSIFSVKTSAIAVYTSWLFRDLYLGLTRKLQQIWISNGRDNIGEK